MGKMIVPKESATLGFPNETSFGLTGDHLTITKYNSNSDPNYTIVSGKLKTLVKEMVEKATARRAASDAS